MSPPYVPLRNLLPSLVLHGSMFDRLRAVTQATNAIKTMQGFPFFGSEMQITFARGKSDCIAKLDGSYLPRDAAEKQKKRKLDEERRESKRVEREAERAAAKAAAAADANGAEPGAEGEGGAAPMEEEEEGPADPNKILFVQGLPAAFPKMALQMLFQQYPGLTEQVHKQSPRCVCCLEREREDGRMARRESSSHRSLVITGSVMSPVRTGLLSSSLRMRCRRRLL